MSTMRLGQLIDTFSRKNPEKPVYYDFAHFRPCGINSYRGYYNQLALGYDRESDPKVADILALLESAEGKTFTGYKGGDFKMDRYTPVWVDNYGECSNTVIEDVNDAGWCVIIKTASWE